MQIICNYAVAGNLKDPGSMYKSGEACSTCPDICDGLCTKGGQSHQTQDCQNFQGQFVKGHDIRGFSKVWARFVQIRFSPDSKMKPPD